jgi:hypothetical protein
MLSIIGKLKRRHCAWDGIRPDYSSDPFLKEALVLADQINDGETGYAIERALDIARSQTCKPSCRHNHSSSGCKFLPNPTFLSRLRDIQKCGNIIKVGNDEK